MQFQQIVSDCIKFIRFFSCLLFVKFSDFTWKKYALIDKQKARTKDENRLNFCWDKKKLK
jgi:hypothetical protein